MANIELPEEEEEAPKKKGRGLIVTIGIIAVLTLVAAGGGWVVGGMLSGKFLTKAKKEEIAKQAAVDAAAAAEGEKKPKPGEDILPHLATDANGIIMLEPITSNLAYPSQNWIRLEVALMFRDKPDEQTAEEIHQDIMAYLRTVSLQQVQSARGFEYLREDIKERAEIRSKGRVKDVLFRTFVIE